MLSEAGPPEAALEVVRRYLLLGIEHIFLGYDHIAFLFGLVLRARRSAPVARSSPPSPWRTRSRSPSRARHRGLPPTVVEPAIAASIVYVASRTSSRATSRALALTFVFGLVHGFGFAGALQFGLPRGALATALAAFNAGVEIGQVALVALLLPALLAADRVAGRGRAGEGRRLRRSMRPPA